MSKVLSYNSIFLDTYPFVVIAAVSVQVCLKNFKAKIFQFFVQTYTEITAIRTWKNFKL